MFRINIYGSFSSAHRLDGYQGACANLHGHNWKVRLSVCCEKTDPIGMTIDFKALKKKFEKILSEFDHKYLNELECFADQNPTSELIAKAVFEKASATPDLIGAQINNPNCHVKEVEVWESEKYSVVYRPNENN